MPKLWEAARSCSSLRRPIARGDDTPGWALRPATSAPGHDLEQHHQAVSTQLHRFSEGGKRLALPQIQTNEGSRAQQTGGKVEDQHFGGSGHGRTSGQMLTAVAGKRGSLWKCRVRSVNAHHRCLKGTGCSASLSLFDPASALTLGPSTRQGPAPFANAEAGRLGTAWHAPSFPQTQTHFSTFQSGFARAKTPKPFGMPDPKRDTWSVWALLFPKCLARHLDTVRF